MPRPSPPTRATLAVALLLSCVLSACGGANSSSSSAPAASAATSKTAAASKTSASTAPTATAPGATAPTATAPGATAPSTKGPSPKVSQRKLLVGFVACMHRHGYPAVPEPDSNNHISTRGLPMKSARLKAAGTACYEKTLLHSRSASEPPKVP